MKTFKGKPITGSSQTGKSMKKPFIPNSKDTSSDAQTMIAEEAMPFKDKMTAAQIPAGEGAKGAKVGPVQKPYTGLRGKTVGAKALPNLSPVGQKRPINQSGQIGGKMGYPPPARKAGAFPSGFKSKRSARFYGE